MGDAGLNSTADRLLEAANGHPEAVLDDGLRHLGALARSEHVERARTLRALSVSARILGRFDEAIAYAGDAEAEAGKAGSPEEQVLASLTKAGALTIAGRATEAVTAVDGARSLANTSYLTARCSYQRAVISDLAGDVASAIEGYEASLPAFREADDALMIRSTLQNLGDLHIATGDLARAANDLFEALVIAESQGHLPAVSGIMHNLGTVQAYRGDIPEALRLLQTSDQIYMDLTGDTAPQHVARCEVLISAGLYREALRLAGDIADARRRAGDGNHLRNALVVAARAALLAGRPEEAIAHAGEAISLLESTSGYGTDLEVRLTLVEARQQLKGATPELLGEVLDIAGRMDDDGIAIGAAQAQLLAARIALDLGDHAVATRCLARVAAVETGPPELLLHSHVARARLRLGEGDLRRSWAAVRSGLGLLDRFQSTLGATDLRHGIERQAEELGRMSVDLAMRSGRPRRILVNLDRSRARALRHRPVVPAKDEATRARLEELRQIEAAFRRSAGVETVELMERRRRLQGQIVARERGRRGTGESGHGSIAVDDLIDELGSRSLLELGFHDDRLICVHLEKGRARLLELGAGSEIDAELRRARFAMRRSARLGRRLDPSVLGRLDRVLLDGLRARADDVIVVPPPALMAVPWGALPSLADRAVSVAPSAEMWWRAGRSVGGDENRPILVTAGPDLVSAEGEAARIASLYPPADVVATDGTVADVREAMGRAGTAHIACHASFSTENPMFSSLRLADGDLNVYDLERLGSVPAVVVLSACDSGYTETGEGDELAGLTSALLSMGTRTVVASVGLVPDSPATPELMERFHRGLIGAVEPARALATAQAGMAHDPAGFAAAASFICVGA
ncbi:MAG TPA: CHAT domain-containing protein [Acidimicrobiia bacterium]|jgi:tetratricopeptide (TPR) repeat protein|nr:CHAT domain-containing protein [Acidimicrobiia bacterium]